MGLCDVVSGSAREFLVLNEHPGVVPTTWYHPLRTCEEWAFELNDLKVQI